MVKDSCKQNRDEVCPPPARALYVHVPFCLAKCRYCDFFSVPLDPASADAFVDAAAAELRARAGQLAPPLASAFLGGGTPTVLGPARLARLLKQIRPLLDRHSEVTVEANPGTVDQAVADALLEGGVNRVNLGVQSFDNGELRLLGRVHTAEQVPAAWETLRRCGIESLGLDLIYGVPGQGMASWRRSLHRALSLEPEHLSCYGLTFEEGTPLARDRQAGRVEEMDESLQEACYFAAVAEACQAGLEHYEISNFARPGRQCRHNITYWKNESYVGIGPGAASYVGGVRQMASPDLAGYIKAVRSGRPAPGTCERLLGRSLMGETLMLGLRMTQGICRSDFAVRFGQDPVLAFPRTMSRYRDLGALVVTEAHVRISAAHLFVADSVLADLVAEA